MCPGPAYFEIDCVNHPSSSRHSSPAEIPHFFPIIDLSSLQTKLYILIFKLIVNMEQNFNQKMNIDLILSLSIGPVGSIYFLLNEVNMR